MITIVNGFRKITPINGFDVYNPDNARQNNYAWAMSEMGNYLYVGTGRNVFLAAFGRTPQGGGNTRLPRELVPIQLDTRAEIWRYRKKGCGQWELVYKAPPNIFGIRFLIRYTTPEGEDALYAGTFNTDNEIVILKSIDGVNWYYLNTGIPGHSTRAMAVHNGKLYLAVENAPLGGSVPLLFSSYNPELEGWTLVTMPGISERNPRGGITAIITFNRHLYVATALPGGFELWRTTGREPMRDCWKLVVDKGAGDAANEVPLTLGKFGGFLYIGAIVFPLTSSLGSNFTKPFDIIRVDCRDCWELVIGSRPVIPTEPITGKRRCAISGIPSGFGNKTNLYPWQIKSFGGELYIGTMDFSVVIPSILFGIEPLEVKSILRTIPEEAKLQLDLMLNQSGISINKLRLDKYHMGFDLYRSPDGINWCAVTLNGLNNPHNYGARNLFVSRNGNLYVGTANPFQGCEVWCATPW